MQADSQTQSDRVNLLHLTTKVAVF